MQRQPTGIWATWRQVGIAPAQATTLLLGLILGALLLARVGGLAERVIATTAYPFQFDPTEGIILSEVRMLAQGENIYAPFTAERFISAPYPPLYYVLLLPPLKFAAPSFTWGRIVALLAALSIAGILWAIAAQTAGRRWALIAAGLWLGSTPLLVWANRLKPDLLAVAFSLLGLLVLMRWPRRLGLVALCFALAWYSKQSALAAPAAATLWLMLQDWRRALRLVLLTAAAIGVPFLILDLLTGHGFYIHLIGFHALPWSARRWLGLLGDMAGYHAILALLSLVWLGLALRRGRRALPLPAVYLPLAALGSFSGGTFGGFHNHMLEFLAALCLGATLLLGAARLSRAPALLAALAALVLQVALSWSTPDWLAWELSNVPTAQGRARMEALARFVADQPGEVWSDNIGLLTTVGKPVRFNDPLIMAQSAMLGWWDERVFVEEIRSGGFSAILWRGDVHSGPRPNDLSPAAYEAIRERYEITFRDVKLVYTPR
ncbi:MAG: hypothetical protein KatS3mg057_1690 [Herpetosiphonaceae bacterium]|nr:MAG: hypothetical protein KatS3mg057_1690 [Herpetosiphonaceae bacterium]